MSQEATYSDSPFEAFSNVPEGYPAPFEDNPIDQHPVGQGELQELQQINESVEEPTDHGEDPPDEVTPDAVEPEEGALEADVTEEGIDDLDEEEVEEGEEGEEGDEEEIEYKVDGEVLKAKKSDLVENFQLKENWRKKTEDARKTQSHYDKLLQEAKKEREEFHTEVHQSQNALRKILENPLDAYETILTAQGLTKRDARERALSYAQQAIRDEMAYQSKSESEKMSLAHEEQREQYNEMLQAHKDQVARLETEKRQAEIRARYAPVEHEIKMRMANMAIPPDAIREVWTIYGQAEQAGTPITGSQAVDMYRQRAAHVYTGSIGALSPEALQQELEAMSPESQKALEEYFQNNRLEKGKRSHPSRQKPKKKRQTSRAKADLSNMTPSQIYQRYGNELAPPEHGWI